MKIVLPSDVTLAEIREAEARVLAEQEPKRLDVANEGQVHRVIDPRRRNQFIDRTKEVPKS